MTVNVRIVDAAQYENRLRQWDYDIIVASWGQSLSPGNEQRDFWGSQAADQPGSRNLIGIKNPAVDTLIERVIFAKNRDDLVAATKALDRVLLWNFYVVPQWTYGKQRTARWDRFGRPRHMPKYGSRGVPDHLVVGRGQGGQGAAALLITRRHALVAVGRRDRRREIFAAAPLRKTPSVTACRPSAISNTRPIFRISTTSIRTRPKAACFRRSARQPQLQPDRSSPSIRSTATSSRATRAQGMELTFATLMARSGDEPDAMYGLAARSVRISADGLTYRFTLRPEAKFHDGTPLTAQDVALSLTTLKEKGHPIITQLLRDFKGAEAADDRPWSCALPKSAPATCRCSSPACRSSRAPITPSSRSTNRRSTSRSAAAPTRSAASRPGATSNTSA